MATSSATRQLSATVAQNLQAARRTAEMTQSQLARAVGLNDAMAVSRWERGVHLPSRENLVTAAEVLGRDPAWFYTEHGRDTA